MRASVERFLAAATAHLDLGGPVALLRSGNRNRGAAEWMRSHFSGQMMLDCRVAHTGSCDEEIELGRLPIEAESLQTLLCLDLLRRFDETADLLALVRPLLAPGGMALFTADVANARPQVGLSRVLTPLGLERIVADFDAALVGWQGEIDFPQSLVLIACESPVPVEFAVRAGRFIDAYQRASGAERAAASWPSRLWRTLRRICMRGTAPATGENQSVNFVLHLPQDADWKGALLNRAPRTRSPRSRLDAR